MKKITKIIALAAAVSFAVSLAACGKKSDVAADSPEESDTLVWHTLPDGRKAPEGYDGSEMNELYGLCEKKDGEEYVISSENFGVDKACFEACFNIFLRDAVKYGGEYYEYYKWHEENVGEGLASFLETQYHADGHTWYDKAVSDTEYQLEMVLSLLEFGKSAGVDLSDRTNEGKVRKAMKNAEDENALHSLYGRSASKDSAREAEMLLLIYENASAFYPYDEELNAFEAPEITFDVEIRPEIAQ